MESLNLTIQVGGADANADEIDEMTRQLLSEIRDLEIESADLAPGDAAPAGTKAVGAIELGALAVKVLPAVAKRLTDFLQSWAERTSNRVVKINTQIGDRKIEVEYNPKDVSTRELGQLVELIADALAVEK